MTIKTNDRLTKKYVDEAMDSARQYSETLFGKAEGRVKVIIDDMVDKKLKDAMSIMRPTPASGCSDVQKQVDVKQISLRDANEAFLNVLKQRFQKLAFDYERFSGLMVEHVSFINNGDRVSYPDVNITVVNHSTC
jgi:hypothetical protein